MMGIVWLIDDDRPTNLLNKILMIETGFSKEVKDFAYAEDALKELASEDADFPDLILLDINMPRMNGWEFLEALEAMNRIVTPPTILMLSTSLNPVDQARAEDNEIVSGFIKKPLTSEQLLSTLKTLAK